MTVRPISSSILALGLVLGLAAPAAAQTDPKTVPGLPQERTLDGLARYFTALREEGLGPRTFGQLLGANPNLYVYAVQTVMSELGFYDGPVSSVMSKSTIEAIDKYCADRKISDKCSLGPLDYGTAFTIAYTLIPSDGTLPSKDEPEPATQEAVADPADAPAQTPDAESDPAVPAPATATPEALTLPPGWQSLDSLGVTHEVVDVADDGSYADLRYSGTPERDGAFNLRLGQSVPADAGRDVTANFRAEVITGSPDPMRIGARVALRDGEGTYLGELDPGGPRVAFGPEAPDQFTISRPMPADAAQVQPYFMLVFEAGKPVDVTYRVYQPALTISSAPDDATGESGTAPEGEATP
ncbi:hypothetical protein IC608_15050 [Devosia sp. PTR5]|uniref:Uncharacterized protein n=1 Tax=Devosia oryzisoli TaxID=2774138 RepID=A0A927FUZ0_9HYPH|nr:hypothetical protein [Devosia oryzisoli]MBD8066790.1 hypothetical protein [Devosia oryzisoli]